MKYRKLIEQMTLDEKIGMIHGCGLFRTKAIERLGIPALVMSDGPMGVRSDFEEDEWKSIGYSYDYVTYFPSNTALANTFHPELAYQFGKSLGAEARGRGKDILLAPGINIQRSPLCGRNFEYMSEDPKLIEALCVPIIQGIQEHDVAACVKHFAVNDQETNRFHVDTEVDERTLHEIYLKGFKAAVTKGDCFSIMGAYNKIRGIHCCHHPYLLDEILRTQWGYEGVVVSDWGGVHDTKEAAETSLDIEMSITSQFDANYMAQPLKLAIERGEISEDLVDEKVARILKLMDRLHMLGDDQKKKERIAGKYNTIAHRDMCLKIAKESIVLLKNEADALPLKAEGLKRVLVIGDNANRLHANAGGSAEIKALYEISPLMGIKMLLGGNIQVDYARGYDVPAQSEDKTVNWQATSIPLESVGCEDRDEKVIDKEKDQVLSYRNEALALAQKADCVIFVGGLNHEFDVEGKDRTDFSLPYHQDELIEALLKIRPDTICVIMAGSPVDLKVMDRAKAIVWSSYNGMEGGSALAEVLFGCVNPSGKLAQTIPKELNDIPAHRLGEFGKEACIDLKEGIFVGYRYFDTYDVTPAYCFGHGLSYTQFLYKNLICEETNEDLIVRLEVENIGGMKGAETVQIYVSVINSQVERPAHELKSFQKVFLEPGESKNVQLVLCKKELSYYDVKSGSFVMEPGEYEVQAASSSRDIRLVKRIGLSAPENAQELM